MEGGVFIRKVEMGRLLSLLESEVRDHRVILFTGPEDVGKTAILKQLRDSHIFYLDLRLPMQQKLSHYVKQVCEENPTMRPIFIVDEAEILKGWDASELTAFLSFFLAEGSRCLLVMSTADDLFTSWLQRYVPQWVTIGVGHFSRPDAREFFNFLLASQAGAAAIGDDEWEKIYSVCGGCPLLLRSCFNDVYKLGMPLETVVKGMVMKATRAVQTTVNREGNGWETAKLKMIMRLIVDEKQGAVPKTLVKEAVFCGDEEECNKQLDAMVCAKVIHVRYAPPDVHYSDVSNTSTSTQLVMARSPLELAGMRNIVTREERNKKAQAHHRGFWGSLAKYLCKIKPVIKEF